MSPLSKIKNWYTAQTPTAKGLIWIGVILIIGIIIRWDYISDRVMSSFGISDAMFRYDSVDQSSYSMYDNHPVYELWELETFVPEESDNDIKTRWELALKHLEDYIFPIIIEQVGNFSAMIKYSSTKECGVQLNLLDVTDEINDGIIMSNSLFGGFQSPLVASEELKNKNTQELSGVVQYVNASTTASRINNIY